MNTIQEDLDELRQRRLARDEAKTTFSKAEAEFKRKQLEVFERMDAERLGAIKYDGVNFVPSETVYGQIQDRSQFIEWAKENDTQLLQEKEREDLLNELVRERLDNGEPLPPGVGMRVRQYISQRAA